MGTHHWIMLALAPRESRKARPVTAADLDLEALREVVDAGTDLPWRIGNRADLVVRWDTETPLATVEPIATMVSGHGFRRWKEDAALIVAAVNALPVLLDALEEAWREASDDTAELDEWFGRAEKAEAEVERLKVAVKANMDDLQKAWSEKREAEAEVARYTAVVQGVRAKADHWASDPHALSGIVNVGEVVAHDLRAVLAGGTDTPKDADTERTDQ